MCGCVQVVFSVVEGSQGALTNTSPFNLTFHNSSMHVDFSFTTYEYHVMWHFCGMNANDQCDDPSIAWLYTLPVT